METATPPAPKPPDAKSSRDIAAGGGNAADLLTGIDLGVRICGVILSADEPRVFSGKSAKGKDYSFAQRRIQLWTGNKAVQCAERKDKVEDFGPVPIAAKVTFKVVNARISDGQVSFDIES